MKKHIILIHGAWHGGWCWEGVANELVKQEYEVLAPTMPGHEKNDDRSGIKFSDYIEKILSIANSVEGPVILAGHSSAGLLLQSVAAKIPEKMKHLIFINAFILPHGKCQFDIVSLEVAQGMTQAAEASADNCVPVMEDFVRGVLMADSAPEQQNSLISRLIPQPIALFTTPVNVEGFENGSFKKTILFCTLDQSLPEGAYLGMAMALGDYNTIELDTGHEGLFTHPQLVAGGILEAIEQ
jgi:pimeloyl-ACP methyl ester carboxylesterase